MYIDSLVDTTPVNTDKLRTAIKEIQDIKKAVRNTFSNLGNTQPSSIPPTRFNYLDGVTHSILVQEIVLRASFEASEGRSTYQKVHGVVSGSSITFTGSSGLTYASSASHVSISNVVAPSGFSVCLANDTANITSHLVAKDSQSFDLQFLNALGETELPNQFWVLIHIT